ncbi:hypothetical protein [Streptomyces sp. TRM68416]|uniref:hypothetical protein n=1 Tax=Streptomyces sp. TRM68416 TaxID=2758412 RepID=UPI001661E633|nr:hypothetical protein [Streptomyces sp. TRM68416]MBD0838786.1 hypothetical protein [Streptomyces sp. TRM68416]
MTGLPQAEPQECRRRAEEFLGLGEKDVDVPRAVAFALLAVAGELHAIRMQLAKRR